VTDAPAPRPTRRPIRAEVLCTEQLTPGMIRVVVGGDGLEGFGAGEFTDHYVKLQLPPPGAPYAAPFDVEDLRARLPREQWPRTRTYSVRAWDPERRRLTIDFVVHGDEGVAGPWARAARPGDVLQLLGPGGAYAPDPEADWHLMVGDASVVPAIAASLARVPAGVPVHVLIEVTGPEEEHALSSPGDLRLRWLHRSDGGEPLVDAVRELDFPPGSVHAFVHGEASTVRALRRHLIAERGVPREALSVSGYWKRARTDEAWREEKAEWKRQVEADVAGV
jgi:NADPH-dependent ferric siderophore reductase